MEAVRHAQAAQDWGLAARLLSDHWVGLGLNGLGATAHELLARFPAEVIAADAELAARMAGDELARGSLEEAERYLALAARGWQSVPADRRGRSQVALAVVRLRLARQRGDLPAVAEEAQQLLAPAGAADPARLGLGEDLRALALINLGIAELWTGRFEEADRHLEQGVALAHRIGRPFLEITGLAHWAQLVSWRSFPLGAQRSRQAIELARRHGWTDEPVAGVAYLALGMAMVAQGRLEEAERSLEQAERTVRAEVEPAAGMRLHYARGLLEFVARPSPTPRWRAFRARRAAGRAARHPARARQAAASTHAADARAARRDAARRTGPRRDGRAGARQRRDAQRHGGAPAGPGRSAGGHGRARARHRRLRAAGRTPTSGRFRRGCSRRSPATRSATRAPPGVRSSARWISPSRKACCSRSCSTRRRGCSSATAGWAPRTPP